MRGSRDPSGQSLERARENGMDRDAGGTDGEEGGGQVFRRGSAVRAFPDRAAAKPGGSNRTTGITAGYLISKDRSNARDLDVR
jgi:hypothetical protein